MRQVILSALTACAIGVVIPVAHAQEDVNPRIIWDANLGTDANAADSKELLDFFGVEEGGSIPGIRLAAEVFAKATRRENLVPVEVLQLPDSYADAFFTALFTEIVAANQLSASDASNNEVTVESLLNLDYLLIPDTPQIFTAALAAHTAMESELSASVDSTTRIAGDTGELSGGVQASLVQSPKTASSVSRTVLPVETVVDSVGAEESNEVIAEPEVEETSGSREITFAQLEAGLEKDDSWLDGMSLAIFVHDEAGRRGLLPEGFPELTGAVRIRFLQGLYQETINVNDSRWNTHGSVPWKRLEAGLKIPGKARFWSSLGH